MTKCKTFATVASAGLWLAVNSSVLAGVDDGIITGETCDELVQIVELLEDPSFGLRKISSDVSDANAGIEGNASALEKGFADVSKRLRTIAQRFRPFDMSIVVDEQACASGAAQCDCKVSTSPGPGVGSVGISRLGVRNGINFGNEPGSEVETASALNNRPVAVNILVSRSGKPVIGLGSSAFAFSLAFAPSDGPTVLSGCGGQSFQDAGNGVYQIWLWPEEVSWVAGNYVGRLDTTDEDGFTVNVLVPIRIQ